MPLDCIKFGTAARCQAKSKRTGLPCQNPAAHGCKACRMHGAHKSRNAPSGESHYNYKHGEATKMARAKNARESAELHQLRELGEYLGIFTGKTGWPGRKPKSI